MTDDRSGARPRPGPPPGHLRARSTSWKDRDRAPRVTRHARERAEQMGVDLADVYRVLADPQVTYEQPRLGPGRWIYQRGTLAVAVLVDERTGEPAAISVLPRTTERYERLPTDAA